MNNLTFRPALPSELLETAVIYIECMESDFPFLPRAFTHGRDPQKEVDECCQWLASHPDNQVFVALLEDQKAADRTAGAVLSGYIAVSPNTGPFPEFTGEIAGFYVRKAYRGQGLGVRLMGLAASYLQEKGYCKILVYTLAYGESDGFYRRMGGVLLEQITQRFAGEPHPVNIFGYDAFELIKTTQEKIKNWSTKGTQEH